MPISYCKECATIRSMPVSNVQKKMPCDLCGVPSLCSTDKIDVLNSPADAFETKGYFNSKDLVQLLSLIKSRKSVLIPRIKSIQTEISIPMREARVSDGLPLIDALVEEGLGKKSLNTCIKTFGRIQKIVGGLKINTGARASKVVVLQNLQSELSGLEEKEKEMNLLYKNALDQCLLEECQFRMGAEAFQKAFEKSKEIYSRRNTKGIKK